ncbi:MAG: riboflavin synthase [Elusimicrobia bacterium]|nr:riboflavin synthase [Elusimicrobiota bacterium]
MFTGIIEDIGIIKKISKTQISVETKLNDIKIGDSICVNGVCLTVTNSKLSLPANGFLSAKDSVEGVEEVAGSLISNLLFDISEETLKMTNLKNMKVGDKVNLERAVKSDGRFGGHFVTGHIDSVERILSVSKLKNSEVWNFSINKNMSTYVVEKGSVAIDGISLTVVNKKAGSFSVAIIPHTLKNTTLVARKSGDMVNIETDVLAKYVIQGTSKEKITFETLEKMGYL